MPDGAQENFRGKCCMHGSSRSTNRARERECILKRRCRKISNRRCASWSSYASARGTFCAASMTAMKSTGSIIIPRIQGSACQGKLNNRSSKNR